MVTSSLSAQLAGEEDAVVLIKAAPQTGRRGETVCCAAVTFSGEWRRLYPIPFRQLDVSSQFGRWDIIRFRWRKPKDDVRVESRRVEEGSISIVGHLKEQQRETFLAPLIRPSLKEEREAGRTLALLKADLLDFFWERKEDADIERERKQFHEITRQSDMFVPKSLVSYCPSPYRFRYKYRSKDGQFCGTCQDWEIDATFFKWSRKYGVDKALDLMTDRFGKEYPKKGMLLAMGTHSRYPDTWLINGIIRCNPIRQMSLISLW
jgi:hypothetical protein